MISQLNRSLVVSAALVLLLSSRACNAQTNEEKNNLFVKSGIEGLANLALDVVLTGISDTARVLERASGPIQEIKATIDQEAQEFIRRIQQDSRVRAAIEKIKANTPVDRGIGALKQLSEDVGASIDKLGKDLNKQLQPLADQAKPFLESLDKKRQEIWEAHQRRVAQYKAEDAISV